MQRDMDPKNDSTSCTGGAAECWGEGLPREWIGPADARMLAAEIEKVKYARQQAEAKHREPSS